MNTLDNNRKNPRQLALIALLTVLMGSLGLLLWGGTGAVAAPPTSPGATLAGSSQAGLMGCSSNWQVEASPNLGPDSNVLYGIAVVSTNDIWAVGYGSGESFGIVTLVEHWDGSTWSIVDSPTQADNDSYLQDVVAVSANDVWAVGFYTSISPEHTLIEHWDGSTWSIVDSPSPGTTYNRLFGVTSVSASDVWAVGYYSNDFSDFQTLWNGSAWSIVAAPQPDGLLYGVAPLSANDVWAVGYYNNESFGVKQTLIEHWNGSAWSVVSSPNQGQGHNYLYQISALSANDIWAVGYYVNLSFVPQTLIEHWNGSTWSIVSSPNVGTGHNYLQGVAAVSANDVWAVGSYQGSGVEQTLVEHFTSDCVPPTATPVPPTATPTPVVCTPGQFSDVPPDSTFYPYVTCLVNREIISGYADCTFRPGNNMTRGQVSKVVSNAANFNDDVTGRQTYADVPSSSPFWMWIERLSLHEVMGGYNCGGPNEPCDSQSRPYFRPGTDITRGQLSKITSNAAGFNDTPTGQTFEDVPSTNTFWLWIERLSAHGAIGGYNCGGVGEPCGVGNRPYFRPGNNVTRGQASKIIANAFFPNCQTK